MNAADVSAVLAEVLDPELGINIVSLGLVYGIQVDDEKIRVQLTLTSPDCPMADAITGIAATRLMRSGESRKISLELADEPPWSIQMADASARRQLGLPAG